MQRVLELETEFLTNIDEKHKHDETATSVSVKFEGELLAKAEQDWIGRLVALQGAGLFRYRDAQRGHAEAYHKHGYGPGLPHRRPANMETPRRRVIVKEKRARVADEYEAGLTNVLVPFKLNVQRLPMCICEPVCV